MVLPAHYAAHSEQLRESANFEFPEYLLAMVFYSVAADPETQRDVHCAAAPQKQLRYCVFPRRQPGNPRRHPWHHGCVFVECRRQR
jgi:hypothetical protein